MQKGSLRQSPRALRLSLVGAVALLLAACAGGAPLRMDDGTGEGARPGAGNEHFSTLHPSQFAIHGIDVSRWQGNIDWNAVRASGVKFAWIKATEGGDHIDPQVPRELGRREGRRRAARRVSFRVVVPPRP